jgi:hypothetical protein
MEVDKKAETKAIKEVTTTHVSELPIVQEEILTQQSATSFNTEEGEVWRRCC